MLPRHLSNSKLVYKLNRDLARFDGKSTWCLLTMNIRTSTFEANEKRSVEISRFPDYPRPDSEPSHESYVPRLRCPCIVMSLCRACNNMVQWFQQPLEKSLWSKLISLYDYFHLVFSTSAPLTQRHMVSETLAIIHLDNGSYYVLCQAITWTIDEIL